ncbi:hypothetical protein K1719_000142 [Acacia pycnantha]|nr:hypothetical protein K1719_000142 [Acacia pycnantha]
MRRHMVETDACSSCREGREDVDHVLRQCAFAKAVWASFIPNHHLMEFLQKEFSSWLLQNLLNTGPCGDSGAIWSSVFGITCWKLWDSRNKAIFQQEQPNPARVSREIQAVAACSLQATAMQSATHHGGRMKQPRVISWIPPPERSILLNCDGARKADSRGAGADRLLGGAQASSECRSSQSRKQGPHEKDLAAFIPELAGKKYADDSLMLGVLPSPKPPDITDILPRSNIENVAEEVAGIVEDQSEELEFVPATQLSPNWLNKFPILSQAQSDLLHREILGIGITGDLGKYLGVPLIHSRVTKHSFRHITQKVQSRLSSWKGKHLWMTGHTVLIKSVISTLPSYQMQSTLLPKSVLYKIEKVSRNFLWCQDENARKMHLIPWQNIIKSKKVGGLGIKNLELQNKAFIMKLCWGMITRPEALWVKCLRGRYSCGNNLLPQVSKKQSQSLTWKAIVNV